MRHWRSIRIALLFVLFSLALPAVTRAAPGWCPVGTSPCGGPLGPCCRPTQRCGPDEECICRSGTRPCGADCCAAGFTCMGSYCCGKPCGTSCLSGHQVCIDGRPAQPWDVKTPAIDRNGYWLNPNWAWEIAANSDDIERSPKNRCGHPWEWPCTDTMRPAWSRPPWLNATRALCPCNCTLAGTPPKDFLCSRTCGSSGTEVPCGVVHDACTIESGHMNWGVATLQGLLSYSDHNSCWIDCDHNLKLQTRTEDGARVTASRSLEFSSGETVDRYSRDHVPWWHQFATGSDDDRRAMVGARKGVAVGVFSLDGAHSWLPTELHPVFAMAIQVPTPGSRDEVWAVFFHQRLSEGYCGRSVQVLSQRSVQLVLPWRSEPMASSVVHSAAADRTQATRNSTYAVTINPGSNLVKVTINLDDNPATGDGDPWFAGEIHLQWDVPAAASAVPASAVAARPADKGMDADKAAAQHIARLPEGRRAALDTNLARLAKLREKPPQPTFAARLVPEAEIALQAATVDPTTAVHMIPPDEEEIMQRLEAIREALGEDTPSLMMKEPKKQQ